MRRKRQRFAHNPHKILHRKHTEAKPALFSAYIERKKSSEGIARKNLWDLRMGIACAYRTLSSFKMQKSCYIPRETAQINVSIQPCKMTALSQSRVYSQEET
ncbi:hypothetical protein RvY_05349, partial [Ramazzottius varieornatus]